MEQFFETYNKNQIPNYIYFGDEHRHRKLRILEKLKYSNIPGKEALIKTLEQSFILSHEMPPLLKAIEDGRICENQDNAATREEIDTETDTVNASMSYNDKVEERKSPTPNFGST